MICCFSFSFHKVAAVVSKSDDEIEVIATDIKEDGKPKRTSTSKKAKKQEGRERERDREREREGRERERSLTFIICIYHMQWISFVNIPMQVIIRCTKSNDFIAKGSCYLIEKECFV